MGSPWGRVAADSQQSLRQKSPMWERGFRTTHEAHWNLIRGAFRPGGGGASGGCAFEQWCIKTVILLYVSKH